MSTQTEDTYSDSLVSCPHAVLAPLHAVPQTVMLLLSKPINITRVEVSANLEELVGERQASNGGIKAENIGFEEMYFGR